MKVSLVCDWLTDMGGAEKVLENFFQMFPDAPLYTSIADFDRLPQNFKIRDIRTSFLQKLPRFLRKSHRRLFPLYPLAFESFDISDCDVILSTSVCCSKGLISSHEILHICYCCTPMRYVWEFGSQYGGHFGTVKKSLFGLLQHYMRLWDYASSQRVDHFIAISDEVKKRIKKTYGRDSVVIHPPVRCSEFLPSDTDGGYYLAYGRLVEYKRFDLAVKACSELGRKLIVIGSGSELKTLKKIAGESVVFLGYQPDSELKKYIAECRALLFPGFEDFGIVPVEAMSAGRPVIAFGRGGAVDTVIDGETGILFGEQTTESLKNAILRFESAAFDKAKIREHALKFDEGEFKRKIMDFVREKAGEKC